MRVKSINVTDHAMLRWSERGKSVSTGKKVGDVIEAIKQSRVIGKDEPLPYSLPRIDGKVYSIFQGLLFILDPVGLDEYKVVTIISHDPDLMGSRLSKKKPKTAKHKKRKPNVDDIKPEEAFDKSSSKYKKTVVKNKLNEIEHKLVNKSPNYGETLLQILREIKELRLLIEEEDGKARSSSNRTTNGFVYVQPAIAGLSDLAEQGYNSLQFASQSSASA